MQLTPLKLRSAMQDGAEYWSSKPLTNEDFDDMMDLVYEMYYSREEYIDERTDRLWWRI